jgi:hypothetical protein
VPAEALSDHALALRALLEPEGPGSGRLAGRVAALCATEDGRAALAERVARTVALERPVIAGLAVDPAIDGLVAELAGHLRALLRDVLCGHLDADLRSVADEILAEAVRAARAEADAEARAEAERRAHLRGEGQAAAASGDYALDGPAPPASSAAGAPGSYFWSGAANPPRPNRR